MNVGKYAKGIVAAIGGLATALSPVLADDVIGMGEIETVLSAVAVAVLTIVAVIRVPNKDENTRNGKSQMDRMDNEIETLFAWLDSVSHHNDNLEKRMNDSERRQEKMEKHTKFRG